MHSGREAFGSSGEEGGLRVRAPTTFFFPTVPALVRGDLRPQRACREQSADI